jgi:hypothetical protein
MAQHEDLELFELWALGQQQDEREASADDHGRWRS